MDVPGIPCDSLFNVLWFSSVRWGRVLQVWEHWEVCLVGSASTCLESRGLGGIEATDFRVGWVFIVFLSTFHDFPRRKWDIEVEWHI